jgi:hypothetical protein
MNGQGVQVKAIALRPDVRLFSIGDDVLAFSEEAQSVLALNRTAAFLIGKMQQGASPVELASALVAEKAVARDQAADWVDALCEDLRRQGMLAGMPPVRRDVPPAADDKAILQKNLPPLQAFDPQIEETYRLLGCTVRIRYGHRAQLRMVNSVIGHLRADGCGAASLTFDVTAEILSNGHLRSDVYVGGEPEGRANRLSSLAPIVKGALWVSAVNAHDFFFYIHAGVVRRDDACILLPAAAGSGKSSLTAALTFSGLGYYSDEVALIEEATFKVPAVPLSVCVKQTGWELMARYYPQLGSLPIHRRNDGKVVRYIPPPPSAAGHNAVPVSHIIFPCYRPGASTVLQPLASADAVGNLMGQCLALRHPLDHGNVRELVRWIGTIDCYRLEFSDLQTAVDLVKDITAH